MRSFFMADVDKLWRCTMHAHWLLFLLGCARRWRLWTAPVPLPILPLRGLGMAAHCRCEDWWLGVIQKQDFGDLGVFYWEDAMLNCEPVCISSTSLITLGRIWITDVRCAASPTNSAIPQSPELQTRCSLCRGDPRNRGSPAKSQLAPNVRVATELKFSKSVFDFPAVTVSSF